MVSESNQKFELEKTYREVCMNLAEIESNISMFNNMIRDRVPTSDIRHFALKQAAQCRVYKQTNQRIERAAMKAKRNDAIASAKRLRQMKYKIKKKLLRAHKNKEKASRVIQKFNNKAREYRRALKQQKDFKVQYLRAKYDSHPIRTLESCPKDVRDILENVQIFTQDLEPASPVGPLICHPQISLSDCERMVLNKGPKFMVRKDVSLEEFCLELEKGIAKHNFSVVSGDIDHSEDESTESAGGNSEVEKIETEGRMVFNHRERSIALSRLRCTDFKYNKRIRLPETNNTELEACHQLRRDHMKGVFNRVLKKNIKLRKGSYSYKMDEKKNESNMVSTKSRRQKERIMPSELVETLKTQIENEISENLSSVKPCAGSSDTRQTPGLGEDCIDSAAS